MPTYITTSQAASRLDVDERHVRRLLTEGKLAGQKIGRNWLVRVSGLGKFQKSETRGRPKK